jgi:uncharacterized protein with von Willebrand factor type A (vWA) domain
MNRANWAVLVLAVCVLAWAGCSKSGNVDTSKLEKSFSGSTPELKTEADKIVSAIKSKDFAAAQTGLQNLAYNAKVSDEQKQAIQDVLDQVKKKVTEAAGKAKEEANKAMEGLKKSLPK